MPGLIPANQARGLFTQKLALTYSDLLEARPKSFLRSWFPTYEAFTRYVSIEVERGYEKVAVDVVRGTEGNRNKFSLSTEKIFDPPLYREFFDITQLDLYMRAFGSEGTDAGIITELLNRVREKMTILIDKIERAYELQAAQVLLTGVVTLDQGGTIDFKRKAASLVDTGGGTYWNTGSVSPYSNMEEAAVFLRSVGKAVTAEFDVILGANALTKFLSNTTVTTRAEIRNFKLDDVRSPARQGAGSAYHGQVSGGSYNFNLWTYPEGYENASNVWTEYIDTNTMIVLPSTPVGRTMFGAVPQLIDEQNPSGKRGAYVFGDFRDERKAVHEYDVQSAGLVVPVKIDQIYTRKVAS